MPVDIQSLTNDPACGHSRRRERPRCKQPVPGAAAGGCAFDGAQIVLVPIADAAHLVHGPIACLGNSWDSRGSLSSGPELYRQAFTTDLGEQEIIFGGEQRLLQAILKVAARYHPPVIFVYATCVTGLIGDDLEAVCKAARRRVGIPVIPVPAPGFAGAKNLGTRLAGEVLLEHVIGTVEPDAVTPYDINLIGEYNIAGELWAIEPLLQELGIRVLASITGDGRYHRIAGAHRAKASMMVCSRALLNVARKLEERYGIPYYEGSFYGARETGAALRALARLLGDPALAERTEALIAREEAALAADLAPYRERLAGKKAVLYTGGVKSWSIIGALQELGMAVVACGTNKSTEEDVQRMKGLLGESALLLEESNAKQLLQVMNEHRADILVAGGRNQYTALKSRLPFLDINQERHHGYAGYQGMRELARQIDLSLSSPVWQQVRREAPWERQ